MAGPASPTGQVPSGVGEARDLEPEPEKDQRHPVQPERAETVQPATEEVAGDDPDRDRVEDEHRPLPAALSRRRRVREDRVDLDHVAFEMAGDERSGICATVISPRFGWTPRRARSAGVNTASAGRSGRASSIRSYSSRGGRDRSRSMSADAHRVGRDTAERNRLGSAHVEDPFDLAEPVRGHLCEMGEHLAAAPSGPRVRVVEAAAIGQGAPASTAGRVGQRAHPCRQESREQVIVHGASVAHGA